MSRSRPFSLPSVRSASLRTLLVGGLLALAAAGLQAQTSYTSLDKAGLWSDPAVWTPDGGATELYPHLDGHQAHIGESSGQRPLTIDQNLTLEMLNIWGGRILTPTEGANVTLTLRADPERTGSTPEFRVAVAGGKNTNPNVNSPLNLRSGLHIHLIGGVMNFGGSTRAGNAKVTLESGASLTAGNASNRTEWIVARQTGDRTDTRESYLVGDAGSGFTGYFSSVKIAAVESTTGGPSTITGKVDLRNATVHAFDVSGDVSVGKGAVLGGNHGELRLPKVNAIVGGNLIVGDTMAASSGLLDLQQTHVEVGGDVTLNLTGRVAVTIGETSAGLHLSGSSLLSITNTTGSHGADPNAGYFMQFTGEGTPEGLLYGLAWEGDKTPELQDLIDSFAITWTSTLATAPQLFYDEALDATFIGYAPIPEPGGLSLLLTAGAMLGTLARKKLRHDRQAVVA